MKEINLTHGQVATVDDDDYKELAQYKWLALWDENTVQSWIKQEKD